ncbi:MAG: FliI/YscN family ATPase [Geminicoccaceae bacterium]
MTLKDDLTRRLAQLPPYRLRGTVVRIDAGLVRCAGLTGLAGVGDACRITRKGSLPPVPAEVVGFAADHLFLLPYDDLDGVVYGARVEIEPAFNLVAPSSRWLGRVVDPFTAPLDDRGPLPPGRSAYDLRAPPPAVGRRQGLGSPLRFGVRALDLFTPCLRGQRLGVFAGSGVGKSSLISMIARQSDADVMVIGLIGERGREVREFIEDTLGADGMARSVLVAATSDMPAMSRRRAAFLTVTIAEALRDEGLSVLCIMDSVTRFAMALREIYLAAGEPPTTKGYPPSVFAELPRLLERIGPGEAEGTITGLLTVLVEGDDTNEPVADSVRSILDGHVILDRRIAEGGRFPAVDVLASLSRTQDRALSPAQRGLADQARKLLRAYEDVAELVQLGAYAAGADPVADEAIRRHEAIQAVLRQPMSDPQASGDAFATLASALGIAYTPEP